MSMGMGMGMRADVSDHARSAPKPVQDGGIEIFDVIHPQLVVHYEFTSVYDDGCSCLVLFGRCSLVTLGYFDLTSLSSSFRTRA
jgi:hypothetical protein